MIIKNMSIDDIDYCSDMVSHEVTDTGMKFYGLNKAMTAWLRKGTDLKDEEIKKMSYEDKSELMLKVKEQNNMGEENASV
jgi:hypothetical protein